MPSDTNDESSSLGDGGHSKDTETKPRHHWRRNDEDVRGWAELFQSGITIVHIAERENVSPDTVSQQLHKLGFTITPGHHMVEQLPLKYTPEFIQLIDKGPDAVLEFVKNRVWGIEVSAFGDRQLRSFCKFVRLHHQGVGVMEISKRLSVHRSTVAQWRNGTDYPYLIRAVSDTISTVPREGWKLIPMHLVSGGSEPSGWIQVPQAIQSYTDRQDIINQIQPLKQTYDHARLFGLAPQQVQKLRADLFAYLLGIMVGDSGKLGGKQHRYASMNLDLQLTLKQPTNERLGGFVIMCSNSLGLEMKRIKDKPPSGQQLLGQNPSPAYRWSTERSPLLAWMFSVCLGLGWNETTTTDSLRMGWIFNMSKTFRVRFVQGAADSDGTTRQYVSDVASAPNAAFFANLLQGLGIRSAYVAYENGLPLRTAMKTVEAAKLPLFNEFVRSYRYQKMMYWSST